MRGRGAWASSECVQAQTYRTVPLTILTRFRGCQDNPGCAEVALSTLPDIESASVGLKMLN